MGRNRACCGIFLCLILCSLLASCGEEKPIEEVKEEYVYVPTFYEYETDYSWVNCVVPMGEELLVNETSYFNHPLSKQKMINLSTGESLAFHMDLPKDRYVADILTTSEGYVIYSEEYVHDSSFPKEYEIYQVGASYLGYYDKDFTLQREIDITDFVIDKSSFSQACEEIVVDDKGNTYFLYMDEIYVMDENGKLLSEIVPNATDVLDITYADEEVFILYMDKGRTLQIASIAPEEYTQENLTLTIPDTGFSASIFAGEEGMLYLAGGDFLYCYDIATGEWTTTLKWLDCDLDGLGLHHCLYLDGKIVCLEYKNLSYELSVLNKTPVSEVKEKELVTVTMLKKDYYLLEQVSKFNRRNQDIRLESKYYVEGDSMEELEEGLMDFQMDLISGEVGDIIFVSKEMDFHNLASKGVFSGLDEFLERDAALSKEDLIPSIADIFSMDGSMYGFVPKFSMMTMLGKVSDVGKEFGWTVADMDALFAKKENTILIPNATKLSGLQTILSGSMSSYYDISTGKCSFDGEEFKRLLTLMNTLPEKIEEYSNNYNALVEGKALVDSVFFFDGTDLKGYRTLLGEDISFIGYPNSQGIGTVANVGNGVYTISAASRHKDAAWQFLREFLLADYQYAIEYSFPVTKSALENYLNEEMNRVYPENYTHNFHGVTLENVPMSKEDAEYIRKLIEGIEDDNSYDLRLMNLILEEAESYFSGQKTLEEAVNIIQNRAQLYVDENM